MENGGDMSETVFEKIGFSLGKVWLHIQKNFYLILITFGVLTIAYYEVRSHECGTRRCYKKIISLGTQSINIHAHLIESKFVI